MSRDKYLSVNNFLKMNFINKKKEYFIKVSNNGFTLIETMIAVSVLMMGLFGPYTLATNSIVAARNSKNQIIAFNLAQEGLEYIKNVRDSNYLADTPPPVDWLNGLTSSCYGTDCCVDPVANIIRPINNSSCNFGILQYSDVNKYYTHNEEGATDTIFSRVVRIADGVDPTEERKVISTVTWEEVSGTKSVVLEEYIFNWK